MMFNFRTTAEVVAERRMYTARSLVTRTSGERTVAGFCTQAIECLGENPYDLPFILLFTCEAVEVKTSRKKTHRAAESDLHRRGVELTCRVCLLHLFVGVLTINLCLPS